jgi:antitoxin component of MazEF toxin-antitoxin module
MIRTLKRHGNGYALVVEKGVMELLGLTPETPLEIRTDGKSLIVTPAGDPTTERMALFLKAKESAERKLAPVLENLAR